MSNPDNNKDYDLDYFNSNKMFNDIIKYIEYNGGKCNISEE